MLILPLPNRPDWNRPPVVTLGLILLCTFVFVFLQGTDQAHIREAMRYYAQSTLPKLELPAYIKEREQSGATAKEMGELAKPDHARYMMESDADFMARLHAGKVVTNEMPEYAHWRLERSRYEQLRSQIFTERFSLQTGHPTPVTAVTHMFLHADLMHLAGNMVVLFIAGYTVEASLGSLGFLALFILGGLGACVPELVAPPAHNVSSLGASGAISAVMAAYLVLFGLRRIRFFYWFLFFFNTARWPALVILPVWLANELLQKFVFDPDGQINYLAHFGGFLTGAVLIGLYRLLRGGETSSDVQRLDAESTAAELRTSAADHVARGSFDRAALLYRDVLAATPDDELALSEYLRVAALARGTGLAADAASRVLQHGFRSGCKLDPRVIAQALRKLGETGTKPPALSLGAWGRICERLIDGGEFDAVEPLVLRIVTRDQEGKLAPRLLQRLSNALQRAGQADRAERARRMLAQRFPAAAAVM